MSHEDSDERFEGQATVKAEVEEDDEECDTDSDLHDPTADSDDDNLIKD